MYPSPHQASTVHTKDHLFYRASPDPSHHGDSKASSSKLIETNRQLQVRRQVSISNAPAYTRMRRPAVSTDWADVFNGLFRKPKAKEVEIGQLEKMRDMPYDVLYEIFSHLHPSDLLNLSRTSRALRAVLLDSSSSSVWRASLQTVRGLPPSPKDLCMVKYASIAFDEWCHFCLEPGVDMIFWTCRLRACQKCIKTEFIAKCELEALIPEDVHLERLESLFPHILPRRPKNCPPSPLFLLSSAKQHIDELDDIINNEDEAAFRAWCKGKRTEQAERLAQAALGDLWAVHWSYHRRPSGSTSYALEMAIICFLAALLTFLWSR